VPSLRVKICCIQNVAEAQLAVDHGADAVGLVSRMPSGPGVIPEDRIAEVAATLPPAVSSFLLTSLDEPSAVIAQVRRCGTSTVQLCLPLRASAYAVLRGQLPGVKIVQVVHVTGEQALAQAVSLAPLVDGILLDTGRLTGSRPQLGGTGRTHDWSLSLRIRREVKMPVFLAGGLKPDNVGAAIARVRPFGVDVCSGVRTAGRLDARKLAAFMAAARSA